jgi:hypothetical protein
MQASVLAVVLASLEEVLHLSFVQLFSQDSEVLQDTRLALLRLALIFI